MYIVYITTYVQYIYIIYTYIYSSCAIADLYLVRRYVLRNLDWICTVFTPLLFRIWTEPAISGLSYNCIQIASWLYLYCFRIFSVPVLWKNNFICTVKEGLYLFCYRRTVSVLLKKDCTCTVKGGLYLYWCRILTVPVLLKDFNALLSDWYVRCEMNAGGHPKQSWNQNFWLAER